MNFKIQKRTTNVEYFDKDEVEELQKICGPLQNKIDKSPGIRYRIPEIDKENKIIWLIRSEFMCKSEEITLEPVPYEKHEIIKREEK